MSLRRYIRLSLNRILSGILYVVVQCYDGGWYVKAAVSIVLQGKNVDISWPPHFFGTLNSMAFLLLLSFVLAYSTKANLNEAYLCVKLWRKKRQQRNF